MNPKRRIFLVAWFICIYPVFDVLRGLELGNTLIVKFNGVRLAIGLILAWYLMKRSQLARVLMLLLVVASALFEALLLYLLYNRPQGVFSFDLLFRVAIYLFCAWALYSKIGNLYFNRSIHRASFGDDTEGHE